MFYLVSARCFQYFGEIIISKFFCLGVNFSAWEFTNLQTEVAEELASIQLAFMEGNTDKLEVPLETQRQFLAEKMVPPPTEESFNCVQKKKTSIG